MTLVRAACAAAFALAGLSGLAGPSAGDPPPWIAIDYAEIVDRRQPTHSGEPLGVLLDRLDGRPAPVAGERPQDALDHTLIDPWLESYAFVLPDALDDIAGLARRPFSELAWRWSEGEAQPAWVELLRARRFVVESDGEAEVRVFAPIDGDPDRDPEIAARRAWERAWPVLRHPLAALARERGGERTIRVRTYPYAHRPERTTFLLGLRPYEAEIGAEVPPVARPPLDLAAWTEFLDSGLTLEGARLEPDGRVRLLGARRDRPATLVGSPVSLGDLAVAYRAVFHGGRAEPYMSLDRGPWPETAVVNYGGRLRDTRLGEVALRCDIRFKTVSLGWDILEGVDVRDRIREALPGFRTHLERFAADPAATGVLSQQTRLWFYPDAVDLTLSAQGDVLVLRRVRMSAASERVASAAEGAAAGEDPPWTRATVDAVNRDYDALAARFPELGDLDQTVRLLALFSWLRRAEADGLVVPDLDALLAVELPAWPTPRTFPQLLAFNALPPAGAGGAVETLARPDVHAAITRARPTGGAPLPPRRRYRRAIARLDPSIAEHRALLDEVARYDVAALDGTALDYLAYRAERLWMHRLVLATVPEAFARPLAERFRGGEALRAFSVAIGGLDLGMRRAIDRAPRRSLGLVASVAAPGSAPIRSTAVDPRPDPPAARTAPSSPVAAEQWPPTARVAVADARDPRGAGSVRVEADRDGPAARLRIVTVAADGSPMRVVRHETGRTVRLVLERSGDRIRVRGVEAGEAVAPAAEPAPAEGIAWLRLGAGPRPAADRPIADPDRELDALTLRWTVPDGGGFAADHPRADLLRLLLGPAMERGSGEIPGVHPLPGSLGGVERLLIAASPAETRPPWVVNGPEAPEETAGAFAEAMRRWPARGEGPAVAVGVRADAARRWATAPAIGKRSGWIVPADAFPGASATAGDRLRAACGGDAAPSVAALRGRPALVVLVSAEPPDRLAERAARLASDPAMAGRLLAVVAVGVPVRPDLAAALLGAGDLAGVGTWVVPATEVHALDGAVRALRERIDTLGRKARVDDLGDGPLWYF